MRGDERYEFGDALMDLIFEAFSVFLELVFMVLEVR